MRQKVDQTWVTLLNNIKTGNYRKPGEYFTIKIYKKSDYIYCNKTFHTWTEIAAVEEHNKKIIDSLPNAIVPDSCS